MCLKIVCVCLVPFLLVIFMSCFVSAISCGVITSDVLFDSNVNYSGSGNCFIVSPPPSSSGITVNCGGYNVTKVSSSGGVAFSLNTSANKPIVVLNCNINSVGGLYWNSGFNDYYKSSIPFTTSVEIKNSVIQNCLVGVDLYIGVKNLKVYNNVFKNVEYGISFDGTSSPGLYDFIGYGNNISYNNISASVAGVYMTRGSWTPTSRGWQQNDSIHNNYFSDCGSALRLNDSSSAGTLISGQIFHNNFINNCSYGVRLGYGSTSNNIVDNKFSNITYYAVSIEGYSNYNNFLNNTISEGNVSSSSNGGFSFGQTLYCNYGLTANNVFNNTITGYYYGIKALCGGLGFDSYSPVYWVGNNISNTTYAIYVDNSGDVNNYGVCPYINNNIFLNSSSCAVIINVNKSCSWFDNSFVGNAYDYCTSGRSYNTTFINSSIDSSKISFEDTSVAVLKFYMDILVKYLSDGWVSNASVLVYHTNPITGSPVIDLNSLTNATGGVSQLLLTRLTKTSSQTLNYAPYYINVSKTGYALQSVTDVLNKSSFWVINLTHSNYPTVNITFPVNGSVCDDVCNITWSLYNASDANWTYHLYYSNNSVDYNYITSLGAFNYSYVWNTTNMPSLDTYKIKIVGENYGSNNSGDLSDGLFIISHNIPPFINYSNFTQPYFYANTKVFVNLSDVENDSISWVNITVIAPNGSVVINNENASNVSKYEWYSVSNLTLVNGTYSVTVVAKDVGNNYPRTHNYDVVITDLVNVSPSFYSKSINSGDIFSYQMNVSHNSNQNFSFTFSDNCNTSYFNVTYSLNPLYVGFNQVLNNTITVKSTSTPSGSYNCQIFVNRSINNYSFTHQLYMSVNITAAAIYMFDDDNMTQCSGTACDRLVVIVSGNTSNSEPVWYLKNQGNRVATNCSGSFSGTINQSFASININDFSLDVGESKSIYAIFSNPSVGSYSGYLDITCIGYSNGTLVSLYPNNKPYITLIVNEGGGSGEGGGGGSTIMTVVQQSVVGNITGTCNFNGICEPERGEDIFNCGTDIEYKVGDIVLKGDCKPLGISQFFCTDPTQPCKASIIFRVLFFIGLGIFAILIIRKNLVR